MWFSIGSLKKSFHYAWNGLKYTFQHEQNFRLHLIITAIVLGMMFLFSVKQWEAVALIFVIVAVLILEIMNTIFERFVDLLMPRLNHYSEIIKDMMAAAVFLASAGAAIVGFIIFYP